MLCLLLCFQIHTGQKLFSELKIFSMTDIRLIPGVQRLLNQIRGIKSSITSSLNKLEESDSTNFGLFKRQESQILEWVGKIEKINDIIKAKCEDEQIELNTSQSESDYIFVVHQKLSCLEEKFQPISNNLEASGLNPNITSANNSVNNNNNNEVQAIANAIKNLQQNTLTPRLTCPKFSGKVNSQWEFKNFLVQFENCVNQMTTLTARFSYLRSLLEGYAFQVISHLTVTEANYQVALNMLIEEFLDSDFLVDEMFKELLTDFPAYDVEYLGVKKYIAKVRASLYELSNTFHIDLLSEDSGGNKLISHVVFNKLPGLVKRELVNIVKTNYPKIQDIFSNYQAVIRTILKTSTRKYDNKNNKIVQKSDLNNIKLTKTNEKEKNLSTLENFNISAEQVNYYCKFCRVTGHSMLRCSKYNTIQQRKRICEELKLCIHCSSSKHKSSECLGLSNKLTFSCNKCSKKSHISALCDKFSNINSNICINNNLNNRDNLYLLPIICLNIFKGKKKYSLNCLLDTGSQRSYISRKFVNSLNYDEDKFSNIQFNVKTFLSSKIKNLKEITLEIEISPKKQIPLPLLVDDEFCIKFCIDGLQKALCNFKKFNVNLSANFGDKDEVHVDGLLGIDIINLLEPFNHERLFNGKAFNVFNGLVPYGNIESFLFPNQVKLNEHNNFVDSSYNYNHIIENLPKINETQLNFILNPKKTYADPLSSFFDESLIERNIEQMFSLDKFEENNNNSYDNDKIREFRENISYINNKYYIKLPWYEDKLEKVPSNHNIALAVLDKVVNKLEAQGLLDDYNNVFLDQEENQIIEQFKVEPHQYSQYKWIPHRPVFRMEGQVTTKIRPVFNCSLKTNQGYSLNEASYPGINLMTDLLELLLYFRTNKFILLSDIRKAFLQIKLKDENDMNRFCFFVKINDKLITYRYKSLIFGLNCSPFVLNYIIKYHLEKFQNDLCTEILSTKLYVDNLVFTSQSVEELYYIYRESTKRMKMGGFDLRSWVTNNNKLKKDMILDNVYVDHKCENEKMLGYLYNCNNDTLLISGCKIDSNILTKRNILSQCSKIFDPLSFCLPITVRSKILMRKLWLLKLSWDEKIVNSQIINDWKELSIDLNKLKDLQFPRCAMNNVDPVELYLFCDASRESYGFVAYVVQNETTNFLIAKNKVSPIKSKSLPTLELLSVHTAIKCLNVILKAYNNIKINNIYILVDAQIVLSWLLTDINKIKNKNIFTQNRIKEINFIKEDVINKFSVNIAFRYVHTSSNPADLCSRGLKFNKFKDKLSNWLYGPDWLNSYPVKIPKFKLECLSERNKTILQNNMIGQNIVETKPVISFERFSDFDKLLKATSFIFFIKNKIKKVNEDEIFQAKLYLIKCMQLQCFQNELQYLLNNNNSNIKPTNLIYNLNLFLDNNGIIRTAGRIDKTQSYDYEILNPILLHKSHTLTKLLIKYYHEKVKHLGIAATLTKVRLSGFWIPRSRQSVKNVISSCYLCKKFNSLAFKYPKLTNLPKERVNYIRPYQNVGVDYTGHVFVKTDDNKTNKMYLLVMTCLNIRSVHIELVQDMGTCAFVQALIRFSNQHGIPSKIFSDNARSFDTALGSNLIEYHVKSKEYIDKFQVFNIRHLKIPVYAPWFGGCWERLIRTIKKCLYKSIGKNKLTYFELLTLLSDVQNAINSRPLTYRCSSDSGLEIITPNCFLRARLDTELILNSNIKNKKIEPSNRQELVRSLSNRENMLNKFKNFWFSEYLLSLRETCYKLHQVNFSNKIQKDDVVLIKNPLKPKPYWSMGRVIEIFPGYDKNVRSVKLKLGNGNEVIHSLKNLYPLELSLTHNTTSENSPKIDNVNLNDSFQDFSDDENVSIDVPDRPISDDLNSNSNSNRPKRANAGKLDYKNNPYLYY